MKRISIIRDDHMGDMILTTGLVRTLLARGYELSLLGRRIWGDIWNGYEGVSTTAIEDLKLGQGMRSRALGIRRWIIGEAVDLVFLPVAKKEFLLAATLAGKKRYVTSGRVLGRLLGFRCLRSGLVERPRHYADVMLDFARALEIPESELIIAPKLVVSSPARETVLRMLGAKIPGDRKCVLVHPFHGNKSCHPTAEIYRQLIEKLLREDRVSVVMTGSAGEGKQFFAEQGGIHSPYFWDSTGELDLEELFALVEACAVVVCGSTGVLHIASALKTPTVSAFCPHPAVGPAMWHSFAEHQEVLCPDIGTCERTLGSQDLNCRMPHGPGYTEIFEKIRLFV